jgi:RNA polymerase sigma-70 factor (ECF subfamily)
MGSESMEAGAASASVPENGAEQTDRSDKSAMVEDLTFPEFYRVEYSRVVRATVLAGADMESAQECAQEAFIRAYVRWDRLGSEPWAVGWVVTTSTNLSRRKFARAKSLQAANAVDPPENDLDQALQIRDAIAALPRRQREAAVLFYLLDLPVEMVAAAMHCSRGSVKTHLHRARASMRRTLSDGTGDEP